MLIELHYKSGKPVTVNFEKVLKFYEIRETEEKRCAVKDDDGIPALDVYGNQLYETKKVVTFVGTEIDFGGDDYFSVIETYEDIVRMLSPYVYQCGGKA